MSSLSHYLHVHLAGSAAGIDLFERFVDGTKDTALAEEVATIRDQIRAEREELLTLADATGAGENRAMTLLARVGERLGRLKPNGALTRRTRLTDLVELEALCTAVAGKHCGWNALLSIADDTDGLDRNTLERLRDQALEQRKTLLHLHRQAAAGALSN